MTNARRLCPPPAENPIANNTGCTSDNTLARCFALFSSDRSKSRRLILASGKYKVRKISDTHGCPIVDVRGKKPRLRSNSYNGIHLLCELNRFDFNERLSSTTPLRRERILRISFELRTIRIEETAFANVGLFGSREFQGTRKANDRVARGMTECFPNPETILEFLYFRPFFLLPLRRAKRKFHGNVKREELRQESVRTLLEQEMFIIPGRTHH